MNTMFKPVGIITGLVAGLIGKRIFDWAWSLVDDEEAPEPKHREIATGKLVAALAMQGVITRVVRGMVDHGMRHGFERLTGEWPGEQRPEPKED